MTAMFIGMSPEQGITTGDSLIQRATQLLTTLNNATSAVQGAQWVGEDREAFVGKWSGVATGIEESSTLSRTKGETLKNEAQQQTATSAANGGSRAANKGAPAGATAQ